MGFSVFKTATNHTSCYLEKPINKQSWTFFRVIFLFSKLFWKRYLDSNLAPSHAESHNFIFYKLELGVISNIENWENDFEYEYGLKSFSSSSSLLMLTSSNIKTLTSELLRGRGAIGFPTYVEHNFMTDMLTFHHVCLLKGYCHLHVTNSRGYLVRRREANTGNHIRRLHFLALQFLTVVTYW